MFAIAEETVVMEALFDARHVYAPSCAGLTDGICSVFDITVYVEEFESVTPSFLHIYEVADDAEQLRVVAVPCCNIVCDCGSEVKLGV